MVNIQNKLLNETAKALVGQSYDKIGEAAYSEDEEPMSQNVSDFGSEVGDRSIVTASRQDNDVIFESLRTGTQVVNEEDGDTLSRIGFMPKLDNAPMIIAGLPGITHTPRFDFSFQLEVRVRR